MPFSSHSLHDTVTHSLVGGRLLCPRSLSERFGKPLWLNVFEWNDAVRTMGSQKEQGQHCRLSGGAWQASGTSCRWRGCACVPGSAAIRMSRNPYRFPLDTGLWCQCSQKCRWHFSTHKSLNSHHLHPEEAACLDFLISDHVLLALLCFFLSN